MQLNCQAAPLWTSTLLISKLHLTLTKSTSLVSQGLLKMVAGSQVLAAVWLVKGWGAGEDEESGLAVCHSVPHPNFKG